MFVLLLFLFLCFSFNILNYFLHHFLERDAVNVRVIFSCEFKLENNAARNGENTVTYRQLQSIIYISIEVNYLELYFPNVQHNDHNETI